METSRGAWSVARSVWVALFIREFLQRVLTDRFGWFWVVAQPIAQVLLLVLVRDLIGRMKFIVGAEFIPWIICGLMVFTLFSEAIVRALGAIDANRGLFTYRQVKPIDTVLVRVFLEGVIKSLVFFILLVAISWFDNSFYPSNLSGALAIWVLTWGIGFSLGILLSAFCQLVSDLQTVIRILMFPLYFLSGVMLPLTFLSDSVLGIIKYNPALHVVELMRVYWFEIYYVDPVINLTYPMIFAVVCLLVGVLLHIHFEDRFRAI